MELPKDTFVNKDAGLIEDWVRQRIKDCLLYTSPSPRDRG